jgi:hypothetical protein
VLLNRGDAAAPTVPANAGVPTIRSLRELAPLLDRVIE